LNTIHICLLELYCFSLAKKCVEVDALYRFNITSVPTG
jgi:hypothetical protein